MQQVQTKTITCTKCRGAGQVLVTNNVSKTQNYSEYQTCTKCGGSGTETIQAELR